MILDVIEMCHKCDGAFGVTAGVPKQIVNIVHLVYNAIRIGVPLILIIVGMFDMGKAITQQKEDDIKKAQNLLVRKAVTAALVFVIVSAVGLLFSIVADEGMDGTTWRCIDSLLNGECNDTSTSSLPSAPSTPSTTPDIPIEPGTSGPSISGNEYDCGTYYYSLASNVFPYKVSLFDNGDNKSLYVNYNGSYKIIDTYQSSMSKSGSITCPNSFNMIDLGNNAVFAISGGYLSRSYRGYEVVSITKNRR